MFNALTGKIMSGVSAALLLALLGLWLYKEGEIKLLNNDLAAAKQTIAAQNVDIITLRGNQRGLEQGLAACNNSVDAYQSVVNKLANAGTAALAEVQKGSAALNAKLKSVDAMPAKSCSDAAAILEGGFNGN